MRICKPNEAGLIFGQGSPSMMNWSGFVMPAPAPSSVTTIEAFGGVGSGNSAPMNAASSSNSLFDSGVTNGVRDDSKALGAGCGTATNDHLVPDRAFGIDLSEACAKHDEAYSTCGVTKDQADRAFTANIKADCQAQNGNTLTCSTLSGVYGYAVSLGGQSAYDSAQSQASCTSSSDATDSSSQGSVNGSDSMSDSYGGSGPGGW